MELDRELSNPFSCREISLRQKHVNSSSGKRFSICLCCLSSNTQIQKRIKMTMQSIEGMITFEWKRRETQYVDTEMIIFPGDAVAVLIPQRNSGYVQIKETKRTAFFWNQETDPKLFSNALTEMQKVLDGQQISPIDTTAPPAAKPIYKVKNGKIQIADVSLRTVVDAKIVEEILKEHPEAIQELALLCPPDEVDGKNSDQLIQVILNNIHSNQFQETLRLIETAITTGEGDEICSQTGAELHHQGLGGVRLVLLDIINKFKM
ncbi:hypothetical protein EIN_247010 [Entamoeba invadens IP1]|uniref:Pru domain-containing protein n=1 Tax=Entamoeba invadens IP1 TaxID=370355 RepID=A0A0A1UH70_ENTIV|nr:hypothetical protein EIN_247010 [Entamoeba invadens IP1]ELP94807.1 hypothetical protein EIN_247010 [Entamoeba invadens IP1]|eukprot:XP_004261578.1 hypothetical protein EIN_247010 [Entamoeba invadens IP1]